MKIRMMVAAVLMLASAGLAIGAEEEKSPAQGQRPPVKMQAPDRREMGRREMPNMEERFREMQASRANLHQKAIDELLQLKKLAEEENAPKTAAAIQAMIDKRNEEYKKNTEQVERQRRERAEQLQQRMSERQTQMPAQQPAGGAQPEAQQ